MKFARENGKIIGVTPDYVADMEIVAFIQTEIDKKETEENIEDFILRKTTEFFANRVQESLTEMRGACKICEKRL